MDTDKHCFLYDDAEICYGDCSKCTEHEEYYQKFEIYKYDELPYPMADMLFGLEGTSTLCCPACHRKRVYTLKEAYKTCPYNDQGDCMTCKYYLEREHD